MLEPQKKYKFIQTIEFVYAMDNVSPIKIDGHIRRDGPPYRDDNGYYPKYNWQISPATALYIGINSNLQLLTDHDFLNEKLLEFRNKVHTYENEKYLISFIADALLYGLGAHGWAAPALQNTLALAEAIVKYYRWCNYDVEQTKLYVVGALNVIGWRDDWRMEDADRFRMYAKIEELVRK